MITNGEIEYMKKMPAVLRGIETQLARIADALDKLTTDKTASNVQP